MTDQNKTIPSKQCRSLDVLILRQYLEWIFLWRSWKLDNRSSAMFSHFDIVGHCFWPKESFEHLATSVFLMATLTNVTTKPHPQFDKLYIRSELKLFIYLQLWNIDCSVTFGHPMSELPTIEDVLMKISKLNRDEDEMNCCWKVRARLIYPSPKKCTHSCRQLLAITFICSSSWGWLLCLCL